MTPGWIYAFGSEAQNGIGGQPFYVNLYDYGTSVASGFYFHSPTGSLNVTGKQIQPIHYEMTENVCTGVMATGDGLWTPKGGTPEPCHFTLRVYKESGVSYVNSECWNADLSAPLWVTGLTTPAPLPSAVKASAMIRAFVA